MGDEIGASRQHLPDRAYLGGDMLDAVQDHVVFIAEDDIAVLSHELHDQIFPPQIPHFIQMLDLKPHDPLKARLGHGKDPPVGDVLA